MGILCASQFPSVKSWEHFLKEGIKHAYARERTQLEGQGAVRERKWDCRVCLLFPDQEVEGLISTQ
jgi:hypothetical protein